MCKMYGGKFCKLQLVNLDTHNYGLQAIGKTGIDNQALGESMLNGEDPMCKMYGGKFCHKLINLDELQFLI